MAEPLVDQILAPFKLHQVAFKKLVLWLILLTITQPFIGLVLNFRPPWPDRTRFVVLATLNLWAIMLLSHGLWHDISQQRLRTRIKWFFSLTISFGIAFSILMALYVEYGPENSDLITVGYDLKSEWKDILHRGTFPDGTPFPAASIRDLLRANSWNAEVIYDAREVRINRFVLLICWLGLFGGIGGLTSVYLLLQERRVATSKNRQNDDPASD